MLVTRKSLFESTTLSRQDRLQRLALFDDVFEECGDPRHAADVGMGEQPPASRELELDGRAPITVKAGEALVEPPKVAMTGYNRSATEATEVVIFYVSATTRRSSI